MSRERSPDGRHAVLLDTRLMGKGVTGIGRYIANLLRQFPAINPPDLRFRALGIADQPVIEMDAAVLTGWGSLPSPRGMGQHVRLPFEIARLRPALFHYTNFDPPPLLPRPFVVTCHDIEPLVKPELFRRSIVAYYAVFARFMKRAATIIAISENTKKDVVERLGIPADRVTVIYDAADEPFCPCQDASRQTEVRARYRLPARYVLYVGNTMPHKNLPRLLQAMRRVCDRHEDVRLLLVGAPDRYRDAVVEQIRMLRMEPNVRFLGRVPESDLPLLYQMASVFVMPSLYEGFGLPLVEALACGAAVVTSNVTSLPEIVGEAGLRFDPGDVEAMAEAIWQVLESPSVAESLRKAALARAALFSWRRCAEEHVRVYREVLR